MVVVSPAESLQGAFVRGNLRVPARLYKYRAFSTRMLDSLVEDQLFFADPSTFNDPLDTKPSLNPDIGADALADILFRLVERRTHDEMSAAAKAIKYRGPKTVSHIAEYSRKRAERTIAEVRYSATNPIYEAEDPAKFLFSQYVETELMRRYEKGIFSLAERPNCPLMWSHYGDQHMGVCMGYSVPAQAEGELYRVKYGGDRLVAASEVAAMLDGDEKARRKVDEAVLTRKAAAWHYEKEWRLIGPRGLQDSGLELEEVVFGMRCSAAVKYSVVRVLSDRRRPVTFSEISVRPGKFTLKKEEVSMDELLEFSRPRRSLDVHDWIEDLDGDD